MRRKRRQEYLVPTRDDGLLTYEVGPWATDKYRYVGMYAEIFATGMKHSWDRRVYLDLFSGPGHSRTRPTGQVVLGSPLLALSVPDPFDRYVFADANLEALAALQRRVHQLHPGVDAHYVPGDANAVVREVINRIPISRKTLSFCFLDPYKLNIHLDTVRLLSEGRTIDFLILLALYVDANRNISTYVSQSNPTIDRFLGDPAWRPRWQVAEARGESIVTFLAREYSSKMEGIGYLPMPLNDMVKIRTYDKQVPLYYLAFFSRHLKGLEFWKEVLKYSTEQLSLEM